MQKKFHNILFGISVLPALAVLPAAAGVLDIIEGGIVGEEETYDIGASVSFSDLGSAGTQLIENDGTLNFTGTSILNSTSVSGVIDNSGIMTLANVTVNGNAATDGGFVYNEGELTVSNSTFASNTATMDGGVIANYGGATIGSGAGMGEEGGTTGQSGMLLSGDGIISLTNVSFSGNTAGSKGGAIANCDGDITLAGTNTFTGNRANGVANDIYNTGTIEVASGTTTIDGGITGTGELVIASGATLDIGTATIAQSSVTLNGTMNAKLNSTSDFAKFDISDSFTGNGVLNLSLYDAGEYKIFGYETFDKTKINVTVSSGVFDYDWNDAGDTNTPTMKSVEDIAESTGLSNEAAATVTNLVNSSSEQLNTLADAVQDSLAAGDIDAVEEVNRAINPETESVAQSVAMSVQNTVTNLTTGRLNSLSLGRNGGDTDITGTGVWAQGIYNKAKQNGAFNGYTRGIAAGVDMTLNRVLILGAGYSYAHSDISGSARGTEVNSSTIFAYGQYKPSDWFVNAMLNYTMSDYSEHSVVLGTSIDSDYDVRAYGGNVMAGYDFANGITPSAGLRYMHVSADEYKNSLGVKNELDGADYLTAIAEMRWAHDMNLDERWLLSPELRAAFKYDLVSEGQVATVTFPGVDAYVLDAERLSRFGAEFGLGLGVKFSGLDVSLNYDIEFRKDFTSQTGRIKVRYEF